MSDSRTEEKSCSDVQLSSQDPTAAKNLAVHALVSRVIASVINEGLALGLYNRLEHRGALLPLSSCPGDNQRSAIVTFPMGCHPLYALSFEGVSSDFLRILFIDPEDIPKRNPCDFQLVQPDGTSRLVRTGTEIMCVVREWDNSIQTSGFEALLGELSNTLENASAMYLSPPSTPTLQSDYNTWEQSLVDGHSTHPVRFLPIYLVNVDLVYCVKIRCSCRGHHFLQMLGHFRHPS